MSLIEDLIQEQMREYIIEFVRFHNKAPGDELLAHIRKRVEAKFTQRYYNKLYYKSHKDHINELRESSRVPLHCPHCRHMTKYPSNLKVHIKKMHENAE